MFNYDQVTTIRAALLYWQEEMCPHGEEVRLPYLDAAITASLSAQEVADLRSRFTPAGVRYALYDHKQARLSSTEVFSQPELAVQQTSDATKVATLFLPTAS